MIDEPTTVLGALGRFIVGMFALFLGLLAIVTVVGMCLAPLFLPKIRTVLEKKYEKYTHKSNLITEEFKMWTIVAWVGCFVGWAIVIISILARSYFYFNMVP